MYIYVYVVVVDEEQCELNAEDKQSNWEENKETTNLELDFDLFKFSKQPMNYKFDTIFSETLIWEEVCNLQVCLLNDLESIPWYHKEYWNRKLSTIQNQEISFY